MQNKIIKRYLYGCSDPESFGFKNQLLIFAVSKKDAEKAFNASSLKTKNHKFLEELVNDLDFNGVCITTEEASLVIRKKYSMFE